MTTALITHSDCLRHVNPPGHPERVERLQAILGALEAEEFASHLWSAEETTAQLAELGFDTRIDEDMTAKYRRVGLLGWKECLERLAGKRPARPMLLQLLDDAELWVRRLRALDSGALQVRRYHALMKR